MENETSTTPAVEVKTYHAVETKVLQEVLDYMIKKPFNEVNDLLIKLQTTTKAVTIVDAVAPQVTPETQQELPLETPSEN